MAAAPPCLGTQDLPSPAETIPTSRSRAGTQSSSSTIPSRIRTGSEHPLPHCCHAAPIAAPPAARGGLGKPKEED